MGKDLPQSNKRLVVIDANALLHRCYHALPPLTAPDGKVVNGVYGFFSSFLKMVKDLKPDYIVACFDLPKPTFRHKKYAAYKAQRPKTPEDLSQQVPILKQALDVFKVPVLEKEGYEADDLIGTIAEKTEANTKIETIILTGDLDTLQLASEHTKIYTMGKGLSDVVIYGPEEVWERYGFPPEKLPDYKGLKGDPSDNIPGVAGVGKKTASKILQRFENMQALYAALEDEKKKEDLIKQKFLTRRIVNKLLQQKDQAIFSKRLAEIRKNAPVQFDLNRAQWPQFDLKKVKKLFLKLGFRSLLSRLPRTEEKKDGKDHPPAISTNKFLKKLKKPKRIFIAPKGDDLLVAVSGYQQRLNPKKLAGVLEDLKAKVLGHDLKRCLHLLGTAERKLGKLDFDARIAAYILNPGQNNYPLKSLKSQYSSNVFKLCDQLKKELEAKNQMKLFSEIEMPLIRVLYMMEKNGIRVQKKKIEHLETEVKKRLKELKQQIFSLAGCKFNVNSPHQLSKVLFEKLGLSKEQIATTKEGHISTAASELAKLSDKHEIIPLIFEYRELEKLHSSYLKPFLNLCRQGERIHPQFNQTQTATGRLSCSKPNLQNVPLKGDQAAKFRQAFVAPEGYRLVSFDYSQVELRIIASLAECKAMIEAFKAGQDIHTLTASQVFDVEQDEVTKKLRNKAKALNFGIIYGISPYGFAQSADVSRHEAQEFIKKYFQRFPKIREYIEYTKKQAKTKGYVETIFGRRRYLPEIRSVNKRVQNQAERMAVNHPVQGSAADIIKIAMNKIYNKLYGGKPSISEAEEEAKLLLQIHDELIFEIKKDKIKTYTSHIKSIMEQACKLEAPLVVDVKAGENWGNMQEVQSVR